MILQALRKYYERLTRDPRRDVPLPGFGLAKISFALVLSADGELVDVHDLREQKGKKLAPRPLQTPQAVKRTVGVAANFLWDNTGYVLGVDGKGKLERTAQTHQAFKALCRQLLAELDDAGARAVLVFLERWRPTPEPALPGDALWKDVCDQNLVFVLDGQRGYIHERPAIKDAWLAHCLKNPDALEGQCLVSGAMGPLARLHPAIKGVWGAQSSGANLVSFNLDAFASYGKSQSYNAPVGEAATFAYTTALNNLLAEGSKQRIQIGDASTVFWSEQASEIESVFGPALGASVEEAEDSSLTDNVGLFLKAARDGVPDDAPEARNPFYILGLSPNSSRIAVRFWHASSVGQMERRLGEYLDDITIVRQYENQPEYPPLWLLLRQTAVQGKRENIPAQLAGEVARAVFEGSALPSSLLAALIGRVRADGDMGYLRAALLKAYFCRRRRLDKSHANDSPIMEVKVSLDIENKTPAYLLGRLFAVLENMQRLALPGIKATMRDKFFASASSAPRTTIPVLLRNSDNHYSKLRKMDNKARLAAYLDRLIEQILDDIKSREGFPATLTMEQQGYFFLGYYQQRAYRSAKPEDQTIEQELNALSDEEE